MTGPRIRALAIAIVRRGDDLLVFEGHDRVKGETFYRPLGGGIEHGELGHVAVMRELREEIGAAIENVRRVGVLENVFVFDGTPGHEIVLVYAADLADARLRDVDSFTGHEDDGKPFVVRWMPLAGFRGPSAPPLYPDGLLALLDDLARV